MAVVKSIAESKTFSPDERQRAAIEHVHGPMLVVAGAGTGKTTVLTQRAARLVRDGHARPGEILALTYTENAAREMRDRVSSQLGQSSAQGIRCKTFHAYCNELLIENGKKFGVLDDKDLWIFLRRRIRELDLKYFIRAASVSKFLDDLLDFIRRCHDELADPQKYAEYVERLVRGEFPVPRVSRSKDAGNLSDDEVVGRCREISRVYVVVEAMLREQNLGTFSHMITRAHELLQREPELAAKEQARARFILVDEFQDANFAQVKILQLLAGSECNIFAVGDPDQAIYQFRGASSAAFSLFQTHFPGAGMSVLDKNRRSTTPILRAAFALISKNPEVSGKDRTAFPYRRSPLISAREQNAIAEGEALPSVAVEAVLLAEKEAESSDLIAQIRQRKRQLRCRWKDFAVLYRQHSHRDELVEALSEEEIPFSIENMDVLDTAEVRDLLACLGAVVSLSDGASLFRVAALPQFSVNPEKLRAGMQALPRDAPGSGVATVLGQIEGGMAVLEAVQQTHDEIADANIKAREALEIICCRFSLNRGPALNAVLDFVQAWERKPVTETGEIGELVEYLEYFREARGAIPMLSTGEDAVQLMTAHTAKGLEWPHVFILRANSGSFPCSYKERLVEFPRELRDADSTAGTEGKTLHDQEERRLFYVAMTRARDTLSVYAKEGKGKKESTPPGYLRELFKDHGHQNWLRHRQARGMQTEIFAAAAVPTAASRTSEWLSMPPGRDLASRLSASAVQTYETCPLRFKLEREWNIPGEVPGAMQYGAAIHRVLRAYFDSVRFHRDMTDEALLDLFRSELSAAGIQDHYQHELYEKQGISQLLDFLKASRGGAPPEVLHLEEWFEVRIGDVTVTGRIDRIDQAGGRVIITDYKTGKPKSQEDADESLQLSIYALAARETWGYEAERLVFLNLEENTPVITARNEAQLTEARLKVESVAQDIAAGEFQPKKGFHCNFCNYRNLCPATEKKTGRA